MPKKTLALIAGLVIVTLVLFVIALRTGQQPKAPSVPQVAIHPTAAVPAHSVLQLDPNPLTVAPGRQGSVNVMIDTSDNKVTAVQLELGYDPNIISYVKITAGSFFPNPVVLINKNNPITGRYTYAFGIAPGAKPIAGKGVVATVTFFAKTTAIGKSTQIGLLPTSLVTAQGIAQSVLKSETGTVVTIGETATAAPVRYNVGASTTSGKAIITP